MTKRALIVVDLQKDFLPGGALPVTQADELILPIHRLLALPFDLHLACKDWHPSNHVSFAASHPGRHEGEVIALESGELQKLWPIHCLQNSEGASLAPGLESDRFDALFYKGIDPSIDSYGCFYDNGHLRSTGMAEYLKEAAIEQLFFAGVATDYCIRYSVIDGIACGFACYLISDCCRGVAPETSQQALEAMEAAGASIVMASQVEALMK